MERIGALSDGVFAIVLTLLVLDLKVPELPDGFAEAEMLRDLRALLPNFMAWLISFVLLARFWIVHHVILSSIERCHLGTMVRNFFVLGLVSLVPFAAALIGRYEFDPLAVTIFALALGGTGLSIGLLARHVTRESDRQRPGHADVVWHWQYHARVLPMFVVVSLALLAVEETAAVAVWLVEPGSAMLLNRYRRQRRRAMSTLEFEL